MDARVWKMLSTLRLSLSRAKDLERDVVHLPGKHLFFFSCKTSRSWREICILWLEDLSGAHVGILKQWLLFCCYLQNANWTLAEIEEIEMADPESSAWSFTKKKGGGVGGGRETQNC